MMRVNCNCSSVACATQQFSVHGPGTRVTLFGTRCSEGVAIAYTYCDVRVAERWWEHENRTS